MHKQFLGRPTTSEKHMLHYLIAFINKTVIRPAVLVPVLRGLPQSLQANAALVPSNKLLPSHPFDTDLSKVYLQFDDVNN
jgi:hypothetical protein